MANDRHPVMEMITDRAYRRWRDQNLNRHDFYESLDQFEKIAVHFSGLDAQVCNGGFSQWYDNAYYTPEVMEYLRVMTRDILPDKDDGVTRQMYDILVAVDRKITAVRRLENDLSMYDDEKDDELNQAHDDLDDLSDDYYKIDDDLMDEVEQYLASQIAIKMVSEGKA